MLTSQAIVFAGGLSSVVAGASISTKDNFDSEFASTEKVNEVDIFIIPGPQTAG